MPATNSGKLYGQMVVELNTDSLRKVISATADDTNKVNNYIVLGQQSRLSVSKERRFHFAADRYGSLQWRGCVAAL
jgi:hypothetical protein